MELARTVAERSTCDRGRNGCVVVRDKRVLATGYVGSPPGLEHCDDVGHRMMKAVDEDGTERQHCIRTSHAEQNALCQAARFGISLEGATLYSRMEPCQMCAKMTISVGIMRVVSEKRYHAGEMTRDMFIRAGIALDVLSDETEQYSNM